MTTLFRPQTWEELFALPNLSSTAIPREHMVSGKLVGDYEMDAKTGLRPCGIAQCHTDHRHGFIVALADGMLSYVGRDCGKSQFGAAWNRMRSDLTREKRKQTKEQALRELRSGLLAQIENWPSQETKETSWARSVLSAFDELPEVVRQTIESRAKDGDPSILGSRYETEEEVKRRAFMENRTGKHLPSPNRIYFERGPLRGISALRQNSRVDRLLDLIIPALLREATTLSESESAAPEDFGKMNKRLTDIVKQVNKSIGQIRQFVDAQNLDLVRFIRPIEMAGVVAVRLKNGSTQPKFVVDWK